MVTATADRGRPTWPMAGRAAVAVLALALAAGCGGGTDPAPDASSPTAADPAAGDEAGDPVTDTADGQPERDLSADPREVEDAPVTGGSGLVQGALVDGFPDAVPLAPDARIVSSYDPSWQDAGTWALATLTDLDLEEAQRHFEDALAASGWQVVENELTEFFLRMEAEGHGFALHLLAADDDGQTRLDVLLRPEGG